MPFLKCHSYTCDEMTDLNFSSSLRHKWLHVVLVHHESEAGSRFSRVCELEINCIKTRSFRLNIVRSNPHLISELFIAKNSASH